MAEPVSVRVSPVTSVGCMIYPGFSRGAASEALECDRLIDDRARASAFLSTALAASLALVPMGQNAGFSGVSVEARTCSDAPEVRHDPQITRAEDRRAAAVALQAPREDADRGRARGWNDHRLPRGLRG